MEDRVSQGDRGGILVVLSAPSGGGKTTLCDNVMAVEERCVRTVTCTTRKPRPGERDGADYHFISREVFERKRIAGDFLEHAQVHGCLYGTERRAVTQRLAAGKDVLLNIDVQGAATVRQVARSDAGLARALVTVFLTPSSPEVLATRLRGRGTEAEEVVERRLSAARSEVDQWTEFDYLLVSDTMTEDVRRFRSILQAERLRVKRSTPPWGNAGD